MATIKVSSWNLQNLFDTTVSDIAADLEFTPENGWDDAALEAKLDNLAQVIRQMHGGQGPDLLGICEVETKELLEDLVERTGLPNLRVAHVESPDIRGIDTSLIYSTDVFEPDGEPEGHVVHFRFPTRDVFEVPLKLKGSGTKLHCFVNHWPSRSRGQYETEPLRIAVAEHCGRLVHQVLKFSRNEYLALPDEPATLDKLNARWDANIILMGDFNDEPYSRSMTEYLLAGKDKDHIEEPLRKSPASEQPARRHTPTVASYLRKEAYLFNCMWPVAAGADRGSYYFGTGTNTMNQLDHFIVSRGLLYGHAGLKIDLDSVRIFTPDIMASGAKKRPKAFDKKTKKGYSDHFPIEAEITVL